MSTDTNDPMSTDSNDEDGVEKGSKNEESEESEETEEKKEEKDLPPLEEGWEDISNDRGILKKIIKEGNGTKPQDGSKISCHYVGTLKENGKKFDSSRDRGEPFSFDLGKGNVIKGWDIGIATMKQGEICILRCAPEYAYGDQNQGDIPPNSTLDFEVELLDWDNWQSLSGENRGIKKKIVDEGDGGFQQPESGAVVTVSYIARYTVDKSTKNEESWKQFAEEANVQFIVDDDDVSDDKKNDAKYVQGFHVAIQDMKKGSKAIFIINPAKGYGDKEHQQYGIPSNATLIYEITLHDFTNPKKTWEMSLEEHFTESEMLKTNGNEAFKEHKYFKALRKYNRAVEILEENSSFDEEKKKKSNATLGALYNNLSLIYCKQQEYSQALTQANKALKINPNDVKALTRKGQSTLMLGNWEEARVDLKQALKLKPKDDFIENLLRQCNEKIKQYQEKQKSLFGQMFAPKKSSKKSTNNDTNINTNTN